MLAARQESLRAEKVKTYMSTELPSLVVFEPSDGLSGLSQAMVISRNPGAYKRL